MFKRTLVASAVLAVTSGFAFANGGTISEPQHVGNCYVGIAISSDIGVVKSSQDADWVQKPLLGRPFVDAGEIYFASDWDQGLRGIDGELYVGYGWLWNDHYYFGLEGFGAVSSAKGDHNLFYSPNSTVTESHKSTFRLENKAGLRALLGTKLTDSTLWYVSAGWLTGRFKVSEAAFTNAPTSGGLITRYVLPIATFEERSNKGGYELDIGVDTMISRNVSLRLEYDYDHSSKLEGTIITPGGFQSPIFSPGSERMETKEFSFQPTVHQFVLGVSYHFNGGMWV